MTITNISEQKKRDRYYNIFINGEYSFRLSGVDVLYYKITIGDKISTEKYNFLVNHVVFEKAKEQAYFYLSYKLRTEQEVRNKLFENDYSEETINQVIDSLKEYKYINDEDYILKFIKEKINLKKEGPIKISHELKIKGVDKNILDKIFLDYDFEIENSIIYHLGKKISSNKNNLDFKEKNKIFNFLARKGFSYEDIKYYFDIFLNKN